MPFQDKEKKQRLRKWEACLACDKIRVTFTFSSRDWLPLSLPLSISSNPLGVRTSAILTLCSRSHIIHTHAQTFTPPQTPHTYTYNTKKPLPWLPLPPILSPEGSDPHHTQTHGHFYRLMGCLVDTLTSDTLCSRFDFFFGELCSSKKQKTQFQYFVPLCVAIIKRTLSVCWHFFLLHAYN